MSSIPVRLSSALARRARQAALVQDRSVTEQVEHWARLGELVEAVVSNESVYQLKAVSHDDELRERLASADTVSGRRKTARLIRKRRGPWYGTASDDPHVIVKIDEDGTETRGRIVKGKFVPSRA